MNFKNILLYMPTLYTCSIYLSLPSLIFYAAKDIASYKS